MIIPDEIISKNPVLETNIKKVEEGISKFSETSEEKNELSDTIGERVAYSTIDYCLGLLPDNIQVHEKFMETITTTATFDEAIAFVKKETGKNEEEIKKGLGEVLNKTFSDTIAEIKIHDEINTETKLPIK